MNRLSAQNQLKKPTTSKISATQGILINLNKSKAAEENNLGQRRDSQSSQQQGLVQKKIITPRDQVRRSDD